MEFNYILYSFGSLILLILILKNSTLKIDSGFINNIIKNDKCICGSGCSIQCDTGEHYGSKELIYIKFNCDNTNCKIHKTKQWFYCKDSDPLFKRLLEFKTEENIRRFTLNRLWVIELPIVKLKDEY